MHTLASFGKKPKNVVKLIKDYINKNVCDTYKENATTAMKKYVKKLF